MLVVMAFFYSLGNTCRFVGYGMGGGLNGNRAGFRALPES